MRSEKKETDKLDDFLETDTDAELLIGNSSLNAKDLYERGLLKLEKSSIFTESTAVSLFLEAAAKGYVPALFRLGVCFQKGVGGVGEDMKQAVEYYRAGARLNSDAQAALGFCYMQGKGVEQNFEEALRWLARSAAHTLSKVKLSCLEACRKQVKIELISQVSHSLYQQGEYKAAAVLHDLSKAPLKLPPPLLSSPKIVEKHCVLEAPPKISVLNSAIFKTLQNPPLTRLSQSSTILALWKRRSKSCDSFLSNVGVSSLP